MLLMLAAINEDLAAGFFGADPLEAVELKQLLNVPQNVALVGVVTIGHEAPDPESADLTGVLKRRRRPLRQLVHWHTWGDEK